MSVSLQFDSLTRSNAYIIKNNVWVPNDNYRNDTSLSGNPYQLNINLVQSPSRYRVFYKELNDTNNVRTIGFLAHCRERPTNLTFAVEGCVLTIPASAVVPRVTEEGDIIYVSVLNEPYLYVRMMPVNNSEGNLIYSNNPAADSATFIFWLDKIKLGTSDSPPISDPISRPNTGIQTFSLDNAKWLIYKTCMVTTMRLNLATEEWQIRIYDRYGNDIILAEADNGGAGYPTTSDPPEVDPDLQTMLLVTIKPNYPL